MSNSKNSSRLLPSSRPFPESLSAVLKKKKVIPFTSYSDSLSVLFTVQWRAKVFTPLRQNENDRNHIPFTITSKKNVKILIANNLNDICSQVSFVSVFLLNFPHVLD